jgi:hypothetical protein
MLEFTLNKIKTNDQFSVIAVNPNYGTSETSLYKMVLNLNPVGTHHSAIKLMAEFIAHSKLLANVYLEYSLEVLSQIEQILFLPPSRPRFGYRHSALAQFGFLQSNGISPCTISCNR